jgi:hypothetical protein
MKEHLVLNESIFKSRLRKQRLTHILEVLSSRRYKATHVCECGNTLGLDKLVALSLLPDDSSLMYKCKYCIEKAGHISLDDDMVFSCCTPEEFIDMLFGSMTQLLEENIQSADMPVEMVASSNEGMTESLEQTVRFLDNHDQNVGGFAVKSDAMDLKDQISPDLGEYLSRPVAIYNFTWNESDTVPNYSHAFNPWYLFFNTPYIRNKLNNFAFLRCNLKIKVMINASPFYYGALMVNYLPMQGYSTDSTLADSTGGELIPISQRPHVWVYPQKNEGAEMTLPFFYPRNWLATSSNDLVYMGIIYLIPYTLLQSANGATGTGVTVNVYAWAEDVELSGPTIVNSVQARDEYKISGVASAAASAAGLMKKIPIIGKYATATEFGLNTISSVASYLGYCNPPVLNDVMPYKPTSFPPLASTEISYPVEKLTIDPKNELTVDPSPFGIKPIDELNISYLSQKESYLCYTTWTSAQTPDTNLFTTAIAPSFFEYATGTNQSYVQMSPMCWIGQMFQYWRGSIVIRFKFIASPYHKGRVRITYDPTGNATTNIVNTSANTGAVFTEVVDLGVDTNVEFVVPYNQEYGFLQTPNATSANIQWDVTTSPPYRYQRGLHNGTVTLRVVTALTGPTSTATIPILVSVRGGPDLEFAGPKDISQQFTMFTVQSKDVYTSSETQRVEVMARVDKGDDDEKYLIYFGERLLTLRQLLRRYTYSRTFASWSVSTTRDIVNFTQVRLPLMYGYDPNGLDFATSDAGGGTKSFNWNQVIPLTYVLPAFVGYRGSINVSLNARTSANTTIPTLRVARTPYRSLGVTRVTDSNVTSSQISGYNFNNRVPAAGGQALTHQLTQAGLNVALPMYSNYKFLSTNPRVWVTGSVDQDQIDPWNIEAILPLGGSFSGDAYYAIGTDFNPLFFLNVPTWLIYAQPTPV